MFSLFCYCLPLDKSIAWSLNIFKFPLPNYASCQFFLKLAEWFWREFQKIVNRFSQCRFYLALEGRQGPLTLILISNCIVWKDLKITRTCIEEGCYRSFHERHKQSCFCLTECCSMCLTKIPCLKHPRLWLAEGIICSYMNIWLIAKQIRLL